MWAYPSGSWRNCMDGLFISSGYCDDEEVLISSTGGILQQPSGRITISWRRIILWWD